MPGSVNESGHITAPEPTWDRWWGHESLDSTNLCHLSTDLSVTGAYAKTEPHVTLIESRSWMSATAGSRHLGKFVVESFSNQPIILFVIAVLNLVAIVDKVGRAVQ